MSDICEIECTVVSGLEPVALGEVEKKLGVQVFETKRGRINFNIPFQRLNEVLKMLNIYYMINILVLIHWCHFSEILRGNIFLNF